MPVHQSRRPGARALAVVDQPASPIERAFAAFTITTMLLITAYMILL